MTESLKDHIKQGWQTTFLAEMGQEQCERSHFLHYFLGWPTRGQHIERIAYLLFFGWLFSPVKNLLKLLTEFVLACLLSVLDPINRKTGIAKNRGLVTNICLKTLQFLFTVLYLLVRAVTSPISNAKACWHKSQALGVFSVIISVAVYALLAVVAGPLIAAIGAKIGLAAGLNMLASSAIITKLGAPLAWLSGKMITFLGTPLLSTQTPAFFASASISLMITTGAILNGARQILSHLFTYKRYSASPVNFERGSFDHFKPQANNKKPYSQKQTTQPIECQHNRQEKAEKNDKFPSPFTASPLLFNGPKKRTPTKPIPIKVSNSLTTETPRITLKG